MNNCHSSHHYINDGTNLHYSLQHQLTENNHQSTNIADYYDQHSYQQIQSRNLPLCSQQNSQIYQENANQFYRYNPIPSSSTQSSCLYPCHNVSNVNYNPVSNVSPCEMINGNVDLYGISLSPPSTSTILGNGSSSSPPPVVSISIDLN